MTSLSHRVGFNAISNLIETGKLADLIVIDRDYLAIL